MNNVAETTQEQKKGRVKLLLLAAFFVLPVLAVLAMYLFSVRPNGGSHGELLSPPLKLHFAELKTWQDKLFSEAGLRDKWSLFYVTPIDCAASCIERVRMLRQIHASLGKEISRVQRIVLVTSRGSTQWDALQHDYPDLIILAPVAKITAEFLQQMGSNETSGSTYLIDPLGNVMMRYTSTADPVGMRKDLTRLLTYSWAG